MTDNVMLDRVILFSMYDMDTPFAARSRQRSFIEAQAG